MVAAAGATAEQARQVLRLAEIDRQNRNEFSSNSSRWWPAMSSAKTGFARLGGNRRRRARRGRADERDAARRLDRPRPRLLHRHDLRNVSRRPARIGSVCSGGRYDNLAALYTKQQLPGIGASLGLDRLLAAMEELGMMPKVSHAGASVHPLLRRRPAARLSAAGRRNLRAAGIGVEVYPEPKKLGQQLKYADRRGFRVALIAGENEFAAGNVQVKNLATTTSETVPLTPAAAELIARLRELLA